MNYSITIRKADQLVVDESAWLILPSEAGTLIKELCGVYPSQWNGMQAGNVILMLDGALTAIKSNSSDLRDYEGEHFTLETVYEVLRGLHSYCIGYPDGIIEITV